MQKIRDFVDGFRSRGFYPDFVTIKSGVNQPICSVGNKEYLIFCANNYLGLTENQDVKNAANKAIDKYGVGPGGSRVISGNIDIIEELEKKLAELTLTEDCLTFPTGYMANIAVFRALMDPLIGDVPQKGSDGVIFSDEHNHGSIIDGCKLSTAKKVVFKHDDLDDLKKKIRENDFPNKLIVTEGVFSLEGEIIDLPKYAQMADDTGSKLMIDDAHGIGIIGKNGGGIGEYHGCPDGIDVLMGCLDKAMGGTGGYLCGKTFLIDYLRIASRSSLLSSAITTMMAGAMVESINKIQKGQELRKELFEKAEYLKESLQDVGFRILGHSDLPAIPLYVGDEVLGIKFSKMLWSHGIYSPIIRWPAVPKDTSRFRIIVMVTHTKEQINKFVEACRYVGKQLKIIS